MSNWRNINLNNVEVNNMQDNKMEDNSMVGTCPASFRPHCFHSQSCGWWGKIHDGRFHLIQQQHLTKGNWTWVLEFIFYSSFCLCSYFCIYIYKYIYIYDWSAWYLVSNFYTFKCGYVAPFMSASIKSLITKLMGLEWVPSGADRTQVGPMLAPLILLSEVTNKTYHLSKPMTCASIAPRKYNNH